ncbi:MAG: hypothetical protein HFF17_03740 [Oscillospiraceae bacterium]|nr:hypothetical protein [Oscillospiraceae bacterium]
MQTHEFFRQVTAPSVPDWDAETMLRRIRTRKPRRFAARYLASAAAAAVVLLAGAALLPRLAPQTPAPLPDGPAAVAPPIDEPRETPAETAPETAEPSETPEAPELPEAPALPPDEIHIHELDETQQADAAPSLERMQILQQNQEEWTLEQILAYWGWDPRPEALPAGLEPAFDADSRWLYCDAEGVLWDQFALSWCEDPGSKEYDPLERSVTMTVSTQPVFHCAVLVFEDEQLHSTVSGVSMLLGHRSMPYGPYTVVENGPNQPAGYCHVFQAQFQLGGLYFEVVTENLSQEEYLSVLRAVAAKQGTCVPGRNAVQ